MKRLIALLMGCMLITSAFASCGSDGGGSDSGSGVSASDTTGETADTSKEDDTTEAEDTTDDEDTTTKAKTTTKTKTTKATTTEKATEPDETEDSEFVGKWEIQYYTQDGKKMTETASGEPVKGSYQIEIEDGGTGIIRVIPLDKEYTFTWTVKGSKLTIEEDDGGDISYGEIDGGYLVVTDEEASLSMSLKSVKKFSGWEGSSSGGSNGGGSSNASDSDFVGNWTLESITVDSSTVSDADDPSVSGAYRVEVYANGTGIIYDLTDDEAEEYEFEWEVKKSKLVILDEDGDTSYGRLKDGKLVLTDDGDDESEFSMTFKKEK